MLYDTTTSLDVAEVLERARTFFSERSPHYGAFLEQAGENYLTFRGRGGEEISIAVRAGEDSTRVRGSSPSYGQAVARFLGTLPAAKEE